MEQSGFLKNISETACVIGLALSTMSLNSTMVVDGDYKIPNSAYSYYNYNENATNPYKIVEGHTYFEQKSATRLEEETGKVFGTMRDATAEEKESVNKYIKSISKDTGVNFFDIC